MGKVENEILMAFANVQNTNQVAWAEQSRRRNEGASVRYQWQCQGANRHTHAHPHKKHAKHAQSQGEGESKGKQHFAHIGKVFGKRCAILGAFSPLISICQLHFDMLQFSSLREDMYIYKRLFSPPLACVSNLWRHFPYHIQLSC